MKRLLWILPLFLFLAFVPYRVVHIAGASDNASNSGVFGQDSAILFEAQSLYAKYWARPPYKGPVFAKNEPLTVDQAETVLPYILACESGGRDVSELDSNHKMSRGPAQYQDETWKERQASSGIPGKPTEAIPAIQISLWSLEHGYISQWSCSKILHIVE